MGDEVRKSLAQRVAEALMEKIGDGRWAVELPGIRVLCEEMGVSRQTMMQAVRHLEVTGVVSAARPGKARLLVRGAVLEGGVNREGGLRIVIFTKGVEDELGRLNRILVQSMKAGLLKRGHQCVSVIFLELTTSGGVDDIEGMMARNPADLYIALEAHELCQKRLDAQEVPVIYLGGVGVSPKNPVLQFPLGDRGRLALKELVARGHERIVFLLPMAMQGEGEELSTVETRVQEAYANLGLPYSLYNTPRWDGDCYAALKKSFELTPPSAVVLCENIMVPGVVSLLMEKGLRCPNDVSVICLDDHPLLARFHPPISRIMTSPESLAKQVLKMVDEMKVVGLPSGSYSGEVSLKITDSVSDLNERA